jgi:hypothetical protein
MLRTVIAIASLTWAGCAQAATLAVKLDASATAEQAAIVANALPDSYQGAAYTVGTADLNGDGKPDLIVHFTGDDWCSPTGKGCQGTAILSTPKGYADHDTPLAMFGSIVNVLPSMHNGLHDLRFDDAQYIFKFDGLQYN